MLSQGGGVEKYGKRWQPPSPRGQAICSRIPPQANTKTRQGGEPTLPTTEGPSITTDRGDGDAAPHTCDRQSKERQNLMVIMAFPQQTIHPTEHVQPPGDK